MSLVSVVCCQVEVSATGRLLMQRSPTQLVCSIECNHTQQYPSTRRVSKGGQYKKDIECLYHKTCTNCTKLKELLWC